MLVVSKPTRGVVQWLPSADLLISGIILVQILFDSLNQLPSAKVSTCNGGGRGIRTHETFLFTGFQDQLHRPLGQTSV